MTDPARRAVVALGANLGDRQATLETALVRLGERVGPIVARSRWHETAALIHPDDPAASYPPFLNGCALVACTAAPAQILASLHEIEAGLGRHRAAEAARWRPRRIDLDLILVDQLVVATAELRLPHPEMQHRRFVLAPLVEVWPEWRHPVLDATAAELLARLDG